MDILSLWDPASASIVVGGTLFATGLRAGLGQLGATMAALSRLGRSGFDYGAARAEIAAEVESIRQDGILRAEPSISSHQEIVDATGALVQHRSLEAAMAEHERYKKQRHERLHSALLTIHDAAELAPIFGLAGTLFALSQLPVEGLDPASLSGAVGMAVLSTLYGLLFAHLVLLPVARWLERTGAKEEADRQHLFDWFGRQLASACPETRTVGRGHTE